MSVVPRRPKVAALSGTKSEPRALVYRGVVLHEALRAERLLEAELRAALRAQGFSRYEDADLVVLETDASISVVASLRGDPATTTSVLVGVRGGSNPSTKVAPDGRR